MKAQFPKIKDVVTAAKMTRAFVSLVRDPKRLDLVFDLGDGLANRPDIYQPIMDRFRATETGAAALTEKPRVAVDMDALRALPAGTLGHAFARFVDEEDLDPAVLFRDVTTAGEDDAWLFQHLYETHDIWHVVTGFGTDEASEIGLQAFYLAQFPARLAMLLIAAGTLNTFLFNFDRRVELMDQVVAGWTMGRRAESFLGIDWNALWSKDLAEIRNDLGITPASLDEPQLAA